MKSRQGKMVEDNTVSTNHANHANHKTLKTPTRTPAKPTTAETAAFRFAPEDVGFVVEEPVGFAELAVVNLLPVPVAAGGVAGAGPPPMGAVEVPAISACTDALNVPDMPAKLNVIRTGHTKKGVK